MFDSPILFLDDDFWIRADNCGFLREHGFTVLEAFDAPTALRVIDQHSGLLALVTDIDLGPGANGFDIARHARSVYPRLPVVYISGTAASRHRLEGVEGSDFISKPFAPQKIVEALDRAIYLEAA